MRRASARATVKSSNQLLWVCIAAITVVLLLWLMIRAIRWAKKGTRFRTSRRHTNWWKTQIA
jgi:hypothetical protein